MWDIKPKLDIKNLNNIDFHLNHVGYKVFRPVRVRHGAGAFHLNHVGYKGPRGDVIKEDDTPFI